MKAVILAGGLGSRLAEETDLRPKPMVRIGQHPILWHICNIYAAGGIAEFVIAAGYKGEAISEYFASYRLRESDAVFDLGDGTAEFFPRGEVPAWKVSVVDTGDSTATGGRLKRVTPWLGADDTFLMTYGDGVADLDVSKVIEFHRSQGKLCTVTAVRPTPRFGTVILDGNEVTEFAEKAPAQEGWINGGFYVLERGVLEMIEGDSTAWEGVPMQRLAELGEMAAYRHDGFWHPMDTLRDMRYLNTLWDSGTPPWKIW
ncbi:MAG: glucose-1-phosphate cytidylyltransferase [Acidimicrobiales bacterium]